MPRYTSENPSSADDLRAVGWMVAVHNDYKIGDKTYTFWLLTRGIQFVKGEGETDTIALDKIRAQVHWTEDSVPFYGPACEGNFTHSSAFATNNEGGFVQFAEMMGKMNITGIKKDA